MNEPDVIQRVHRFLLTRGIDGRPTPRLFTDPHPTLIGIDRLRPFQRFRIDLGDFVVHPDLLGQEDGEGSLIAVEAKGRDDLLKGLGQAELYQHGVQRSFLAAHASAWSPVLLDLARSKGVGALRVEEDVQVLYAPPARRPLNHLYNALLSDLGCAQSAASTYAYNLPTHYLVWAIAVPAGGPAGADTVLTRLAGYPMPQNWRDAARGAQKLGLIRLSGDGFELTDAGGAMRDLMPAAISDWAAIHQQAARRGSTQVMADLHPASAAGLRLLLLQDPLVRLVLEGLDRLGAPGGSFRELALACSQVDRRRASIFFLKPEAAAEWVQRDGHTPWAEVPGEAFRSTTFFQHKSILKHAGLLMPTALGGASARGYDPGADHWQRR